MSKTRNSTPTLNFQLIKPAETNFEGNKINSVDARSLHEFLGSKSDFSNWIKRKVVNNIFFASGIDFVLLNTSVEQKQRGGRNRKDYALTIETAKKVAMAEQTERGEEARDYFLECEDIAKQVVTQHNIPQNYAEALQLAADQAKQLELQAPKVEFAETVEGSEDCVTIGEYAKINGNIGRNKLFALLRDHKILMSNNTPYQKYINQGLFEVTEKSTSAGLKTVTLVTGKGQINLDKKLRKWI